MKVSIETLMDLLEDAVHEHDRLKTLALVLELKEIIKTDPVAVKWITEPANIKHIHEMLVDNLDVPAASMLVKNRVPHRQRRALLFVEGIINGVRRVVNE